MIPVGPFISNNDPKSAEVKYQNGMHGKRKMMNAAQPSQCKTLLGVIWTHTIGHSLKASEGQSNLHYEAYFRTFQNRGGLIGFRYKYLLCFKSTLQ